MGLHSYNLQSENSDHVEPTVLVFFVCLSILIKSMTLFFVGDLVHMPSMPSCMKPRFTCWIINE